MRKSKKKVVVAMSGGVDSSVAAKLLVDQGFDVLGIFLYFWKDDTEEQIENKCCSTKALMDARRVCQKINIPLYTLNFSDEFKKEVVDNFLSEYKKGCTPNPCIPCNKLVKLGLLIKRARKLGFDYVASGHYIKNKKFPLKADQPLAGKIKNKKFVYILYQAKDKEKDQSYFLYTLTQEQLKHLLFPIGDYKKEEVRKLAKKFRLPVAEKKESQEICFTPGKSHNEFLKQYLKLKPGPIYLTPQPPLLIRRGGGAKRRGEVIGKHQGLPLYTIGQRKGVEIGGIGPFYVAKCDYKTNTLYVVEDGNDPALYSDKLVAKNVNWISGEEPKMPLKCEAVIRYRHKPVKCKIEHTSPLTPPLIRGGEKGEGLYIIKFNKPQRAITPGQSVVFYRIRRRTTNATHANENNEYEVLGGGIIK